MKDPKQLLYTSICVHHASKSIFQSCLLVKQKRAAFKAKASLLVKTKKELVGSQVNLVWTNALIKAPQSAALAMGGGEQKSLDHNKACAQKHNSVNGSQKDIFIGNHAIKAAAFGV